MKTMTVVIDLFKQRPILFSAPMVRAILSGKKTMTRRVFSPRYLHLAVGDWLWVREKYRIAAGRPIYAADCSNNEIRAHRGEWKPSMFMPHEFSRLILEITDIRAERLRSISEADANKEGFDNVADFLKYFESLSPKNRGENPNVAVFSFKTVKQK